MAHTTDHRSPFDVAADQLTALAVELVELEDAGLRGRDAPAAMEIRAQMAILEAQMDALLDEDLDAELDRMLDRHAS